MSGKKIIDGLNDAIAYTKGDKKAARLIKRPSRQFVDSAYLGLPDAWEGDPKGIVKFLGFMRHQLDAINPASEEVRTRLQSLARTCDRVETFMHGYIAGTATE